MEFILAFLAFFGVVGLIFLCIHLEKRIEKLEKKANITNEEGISDQKPAEHNVHISEI